MKTFRLLLIVLAIVLYTTPLRSQARLIINDNAYVRMNGGSSATPIYIVVENPNANAITTTGTGGNLVSENEYNKVRWNIGTSTGTYILPYTSNPSITNTKFPLSVQITVAGTGAGLIDFSTYETTTDMNIPWASMVTHMTDADNVPADNSLYVVDRYWLMMNNSYTTKPDVNLTFGYVDNATELSGTNTITEANLVAQRWNDAANTWEGNFTNTAIIYGSANIATNTVFGVDIPPSEFHEAWVLVDRQSILPVELLNIEANCEGSKNKLIWSTASETGTLHYQIEKSFNGVDFFVIGTKDAAGNSSQVLEYTFSDPTENSILVYYRIKQIDLDGSSFYLPTLSVPACSQLSGNANVYVNSENKINVNWLSESEGELLLDLYATDGKLVHSQKFQYQEGSNQHLVDVRMASGIYLVQLSTEKEMSSHKLFIK